jgi:adenosylcobinamide-GDP ribazoletransferase
MRFVKGFIMSLGMYSIIPVPGSSWNDKYMPLVIPSLPVVGALIGVIWYGLAVAVSTLPVPLMIKSVMILFIPFILTGFIHLDGYMDTADAVFSRRGIEEKKRILKDPHTGAFAVIALAGLLLTQFSAVYSAVESQKGLLIFAFIPVMSRCVAGIAALCIKPVFETGFIVSFKKNTKTGSTVFICLLLAACCAASWFTLGFAALPLLVAITAGVVTVRYLYRQFKGISGDLCGCVITISELTAMFCLAII